MRPPVEFWSSVECASFQKALVRELRSAGVAAEERFVVPSAAYRAARKPWERIVMRSRAYGEYPLRLWRNATCNPGPTVRVVCSNTFYAPWVAMCAAPNRRVIHWVFDLYPEVLLAGGWPDLAGAGRTMLRRLMRETFDQAAANVFLGPRLLQHAESLHGPIPRARVIAIGADATPFRDMPPAPGRPPGAGQPLDILYCGNLGRMHDTATIVAALPQLAGAAVRFRFHGHGPGFERLRGALAGRPGLEFGPELPGKDWESAMRRADVALVTLAEAAAGLVLPSKAYSALVAGQAILAVAPAGSDLATLVERHGAGWTVRPGAIADFVELVRRLARDRAEVDRCRRRAWEAGHRHYAQHVIAGQWRRLFEVVDAQATN